ncbi:hypothetical protein [Streptomyces sp. Z26]|uniref:hypothetical protein n=1 Tax=Streptomyces sp. Z26 TaxID=2500177 RepID=UPI001404839B|nr:hypothetical protein [Streptomyces sp. Z26]
MQNHTSSTAPAEGESAPECDVCGALARQLANATYEGEAAALAAELASHPAAAAVTR